MHFGQNNVAPSAAGAPTSKNKCWWTVRLLLPGRPVEEWPNFICSLILGGLQAARRRPAKTAQRRRGVGVTTYLYKMQGIDIMSLVLLTLAVLQTLPKQTAALVVCNDQRLMFFHVPKCGGHSISLMLKRRYGCDLQGWGIDEAYRVRIGKKNKTKRVKFDYAHVTPVDLETMTQFGKGWLAAWYQSQPQSDKYPADLLRGYDKLITVRNPYIRCVFTDAIWHGRFGTQLKDPPKSSICLRTSENGTL